jgi:hypothetical protein
MTPEQLAAAERVRAKRYKTWTHWETRRGEKLLMTLGDGELQDLHILADLALQHLDATRDDGAAGDEAWIKSLGVEHIDLVERLKQMLDGGDPVDGKVRPCFKTRRDVLRLLEALQINLAGA